MRRLSDEIVTQKILEKKLMIVPTAMANLLDPNANEIGCVGFAANVYFFVPIHKWEGEPRWSFAPIPRMEISEKCSPNGKAPNSTTL